MHIAEVLTRSYAKGQHISMRLLNINLLENASRRFYLRSSSVHLFYRHFEFFRQLLCALDCALVDTPEPTLSDQGGMAEIPGGRPEVRDRELPEIAWPLRYVWKISSGR